MPNIIYPPSVRDSVKQYIDAGFKDEEVYKLTGVSERTLRRWRSNLVRYGQTNSPTQRGGVRKMTRYIEDVRTAVGAVAIGVRTNYALGPLPLPARAARRVPG